MKVKVQNGSLSHRLLKELRIGPTRLREIYHRNHYLSGKSVRGFLIKRNLIRRIPSTQTYELTKWGHKMLEALDNPPCPKCKQRVDCLATGHPCTINFMATIEVE